MEYLASNLDWLQEQLEAAAAAAGGASYFLFDCPGQVELFTGQEAFKQVGVGTQSESKQSNDHTCVFGEWGGNGGRGAGPHWGGRDVSTHVGGGASQARRPSNRGVFGACGTRGGSVAGVGSCRGGRVSRGSQVSTAVMTCAVDTMGRMLWMGLFLWWQRGCQYTCRREVGFTGQEAFKLVRVW
jgi:hypothetical protein